MKHVEAEKSHVSFVSPSMCSCVRKQTQMRKSTGFQCTCLIFLDVILSCVEYHCFFCVLYSQMVSSGTCGPKGMQCRHNFE